jgi:hypothetical protein
MTCQVPNGKNIADFIDHDAEDAACKELDRKVERKTENAWTREEDHTMDANDDREMP